MHGVWYLIIFGVDLVKHSMDDVVKGIECIQDSLSLIQIFSRRRMILLFQLDASYKHKCVDICILRVWTINLLSHLGQESMTLIELLRQESVMFRNDTCVA